MRKALLISILLCIGLTYSLRAQYYNLSFRNYSSANGLSQSEVNCVYRDRQGFIWVGTEFGLTRYNGSEFTTYYHRVGDTSSIAENSVRDITQDQNGTLWFAINTAGVSKLEPMSKKFRNYRPGKNGNSILSDSVVCILADRSNRVWIGLQKGISVYDNSSNRFLNLRRAPGSTEDISVNYFQMDANDGVWVGTRNGIYYSDGGPERLRKLRTSMDLGSVNAIQFDADGVGWLATSKGLFNFNSAGKDSLTVTQPPYLRGSDEMNDIEFDPQGNLWISSAAKGLRIYFPATGFFDQLKEDYTSSRGLTSNRIHDLYNDGRGGMWVSGENGMQSFHYDAQRFNTYAALSASAERVRGSTLYGVFEEGDVIITATSGGVIVFDRRNSSYLPFKEKHEMPGQPIRFREVNKMQDGKWWITSDAGIFELRKEGGVYTLARPSAIRDPKVRSTDLRSFLIDGRTMWAATTTNGLMKYDLTTGKTEYFRRDLNNALSLPVNITYKVIMDKEGNIEVAHDMGLSILYKGARNFENYGVTEVPGKRLANRQVFDIYDDGKFIYIATIGGGLNVLDKETKAVRYFTTQNGLSNDAIYKMVPFRDSLIYLGTNKGLSVYNKFTNTFRNFDINDGMPSEEFNMYAGYVNANDEIFMGTTGGLISFSSHNLRKNNLPLGIYLSKVRKNGVYMDDSTTAVMNTTRMIRTKYGEDLFLEFSPLVFYTSAATRLDYRIREQGDGWVTGEVGGLLPLVKMEPGTYTIDIRMVNDNGLRNSNVMTLKLEVLPPFWKTLWFRLLAIAILILATYLAVMAYIRRRLERQRVEFMKQQAVEQERLRISAELHDDIGGGLTAIRLLSEMSLDHGADSRKYLERISASSNDIIQKMNEIVWALNNNNDNLQSLIAYTRLYTVSFLDDLNIDYHFDTPDNIPEVTVLGKNRRSIFLLVKESLNNIVKHAEASSVNVRMSIDDKLHIEIHDNGIGFHEDRIIRGNGLNNMRKRVQNLKGEMFILNGEGTTVKFDIPVKNLYA